MPPALLVSDTIAARYARELDAVAPGLPRVVLRPQGVDGELGDVTIAFFSGDCYPERAAECMGAVLQVPHLRWLHTFSAGVDHPVFLGLMDRGVRVTTSSGAAARPIAELVLLDLLALARDLPAWVHAQRERRWAPHESTELAGHVLGVVGLGPIGREVARLGAALGMRVVGLRRTPDGSEPCEAWPLARLPDLLAIADYLVLALPLTPSTRRLIDADALARLRPGARLVNVGRGELVDEAALVAALTDGRLAGAALDVFETEPLPAESPLWHLPHVIVTPHAAGTTAAIYHRATLIFLDNLGRFLRGEALRNEALGAGAPE